MILLSAVVMKPTVTIIVPESWQSRLLAKSDLALSSFVCKDALKIAFASSLLPIFPQRKL
jgi:hypothetical protein